jgi:transcription antitermination factor NusG
VDAPLFPGYVFVKIYNDAHARVPVLQTNGVTNFLGVRGVGIPISDNEIDAIKSVLRQGVCVEPHPFVQIGQRVRICGGSLDGLEGILTGIDGKKSLAVSIELIQKSVAIRITGYTVLPVQFSDPTVFKIA